MKVFPSAPEDLAYQMAENIPENTFSMAEIQKYLMYFRFDPELAVRLVCCLIHTCRLQV